MYVDQANNQVRL